MSKVRGLARLTNVSVLREALRDHQHGQQGIRWMATCGQCQHVSPLQAKRPSLSDTHLSSRVSFSPRHIYVARAFNSSNTTSSKSDPEAAKANQESEGESKGASDESQLSEAEKKLTEENAELKEKYDDLMDKYRRSLAETENMRKRLTKQIDDAKIFGIQGFCKDLLDVADVLGKAVEGIEKNSEVEDQAKFLKDMSEGLRLTQSQLQQVFKRHGLEVENPLNEKFDPNKHEALFQIPAPDKDPNIVLDVQKVGYLLHGRTIRPALVGVSKK